jgi:hypothetical protein
MKKILKICREAGITTPYTNHCLRATAITSLDSAGFEARDIMTVSGHRSEASIRSYSKTSDDKKRSMSAAISKLMPSSKVEAPVQPSSSVPLESLTVPSFEPSTNTVTLPPVISPLLAIPRLTPSFDLDLEDGLIMTSSQQERVLQDLTNPPVLGQDINMALGLSQSATTVRNRNTFNFYNCNVQLHQ